jgi:cytochrome c peroxidase
MNVRFGFLGTSIFATILQGACADEALVTKDMLSYFAPLPEVMASEKNPVTDVKVALGRQLFFDARLSLDGKTSCNSCHALDNYGVDKRLQGRAAPTVYHAALHVGQYWDGRAADVEEQARRAVVDLLELAMPDVDALLEVLHSIPGYVDAFVAAFPGDGDDPVSVDHFGMAIAAFERTLVTPGRFDRLLNGDDAAFTGEEKAGMVKFVQVGCVACHSGQGLGGKLYQKLGLVRPWPGLKDEGRFAVTGDASDRFVFKVPGLRNIARTGPYLHDGSVESLEKVVELMAWHEIGQYVDGATTRSITMFLNALTGELPEQLIRKPELPADGATTGDVLAKLRASASSSNAPSER